MATISDIPGMLGDYMLKGWVLTDQTCPTPGCPVPLMRSPSGRTPITTFCASCNNRPMPSTLPVVRSDVSSDSHASRSSTPPTEISETPSSPIFVPPPETDQTRRRREQSDRASSEIGKRLLQGWAMLGEECPNSACYGVPLVRPPKAGGKKDPRKECVICGNSYITKMDLAGREILVAASNSNDVQPTMIVSTPPEYPSGPVSNVSEGENTTFAAQAMTHNLAQSSVSVKAMVPPASTATIIDQSSQALQDTLRALSSRLTLLSSHAAMDPNAIGSTADAIGKVIQALTQARQLQWAEKQAYGLGSV